MASNLSSKQNWTVWCCERLTSQWSCRALMIYEMLKYQMLMGGIWRPNVESELQTSPCDVQFQNTRIASPTFKIGLVCLIWRRRLSSSALPTALLSCHIAFLSTHSPQVTLDPARHCLRWFPSIRLNPTNVTDVTSISPAAQHEIRPLV